MWQRLGPGPVFTYESLLNARRWQVYAGRSFFVLVILLGMVIVWFASNHAVFRGGRPANFTELAELGERFFYALAGIQLTLVMLAAPAAAAGSMCIDRVRGTLEHTMVTDLSDLEIVLGNWLRELAPIAGMIACGVPVAALTMLLGGVESQAIAGTFAVSMSLAILGCVLALTISIWAAKTYEALLAAYVIEAAWLVSLPIWWNFSFTTKLRPPPVWFQKANPFVVVFAPYVKSGSVSVLDYAAFAGGVLAVSAVLAVGVDREAPPGNPGRAGRPRKGPRRLPDLKWLFPSWPNPTLDGNPVLWREWHYSRQSRLTWWIWTGMLVLAWSLAAWGTHKAINDGNVYGPGFAFAFLLVLLLGFLMLAAMAPTALAEERASGSLDVLLATPLSTAEIVTAKWWGVYRKALVLAPLALYVSFFEAATIPDVPIWYVGRPMNPPIVPINISDRVIAIFGSAADFLASSAVVVSLGLALATWIPPFGPGHDGQRDCVFRHRNRLGNPAANLRHRVANRESVSLERVGELAR